MTRTSVPMSQFRRADFEPVVQRLKQGTSSRSTNLFSFLRWPSADLILDRVERCDPFQSFPGQGRSVCLFQVVELASNVRLILSTR